MTDISPTATDKYKKERLLSLVVILLAVTLCYGRTVGYGFVQTWDDDAYVINNAAAHGFSLQNIATAFSTFYVGNYAPLHIVSYMLDYTFWELNPAGYHITNILLHALNGWLLLQILNRVTGDGKTALVATLIFLIHPVQVESVAWISERKNLLGFLFIMLALLFHIKWRDNGNRKLYWLSVAMTCIALLSKSVAVVIPLILVAWDYCFDKRHNTAPFVRKWLYLAPHILLCAAATLVTMKSQQPDYGGGRVGYLNDSAATHLLTMSSAVTKYVINLLTPTSLASYYDIPTVTAPGAATISGILILAGIAGAAWFLNKWSKPLLFCLVMTVVTMLPVSNIIPLNTFINDRYLYLPMAGIAPLFAACLFRVITSSRHAREITAAAVCIPLMFLSWQQCATWKNDVSLWQNAVRSTPQSYLLLQSSVALNALAAAYLLEGRLDDSIKTSQLSLLQNPENVPALNNLGLAYLQAEKLAAAEYVLKKAVTNDPNYVPAYLNLAKTYINAGKLDDALAVLSATLEKSPGNAGAHGLLGTLYLTSGNFGMARQEYDMGERFGGASKDISFGRACIEALEGNHQSALEHLESAFRQGFRNGETLESSRGLDSLRNLPRYRELLLKYK